MMIFRISKYAVFCIGFIFGHALGAETDAASDSGESTSEISLQTGDDASNTADTATGLEKPTAGAEPEPNKGLGEPIAGIEPEPNTDFASDANEIISDPGKPIIGVEEKINNEDDELDDDLLGDSLVSAKEEPLDDEENIEDFIEDPTNKSLESHDHNIVVATVLPENTEIYAAPLYNKLTPVSGWNRYSCDSASTVSQWLRWWKYLRLDKPLLMSWLDGLTIKIYPHNEICRALFVKGIYNPNQLTVLGALLRKDGVFIDAGANAGYTTLVASRIVGEKGRVIAIEPCQRDFNRLLENIKINKLDALISAHRYAVFQKKGRTNLLVAGEEMSSLNTLGTEFSIKGVDKDHTEEVDTISIDEFIVEEGITNVDVINLDIEGSEFEALKGARQTIEKYHPVLVVGLNDNALKASGNDQEVIGKLLKELKYRAYKIVEYPVFALQEVENVATEHANIIFCLYESVTPPQLPQPEKIGIWPSILYFFK
ncbi:MAG: FkbM family methyltransferase [Holosporaceae bacterium]|jgi:FkbM family methyltransferase|nr:FkbM family methyltransferase [Holosporaceae bacterium]